MFCVRGLVRRASPGHGKYNTSFPKQRKAVKTTPLQGTMIEIIYFMKYEFFDFSPILVELFK